VLVGGLRVVVEETLNHDQVPGDVLGVGTPQSTQLSPRAPFKVGGLHVVRNLRFGNALTLRWAASTIVPSVPRVLPPRVVVETSWPSIVAVAVPVTAVTIATPFIAPVVTVPTIVTRGMLASARPLGTSVGAVEAVVPSRAIAAARAAILPCETAARPEAVTLTVAATPACVAVVRAVLTVLIRHGPSFTPGLPSVPPLSLNTWEEPTWSEALRRNETR